MAEEDARLPETVVTAKRDPPAPAKPQITVIAPDPFAGVACSVEVYPFEGGKFSILGGQILSCSVTTNREGSGGKFSFNLAPGGPSGPDGAQSTEGSPTWAEVITPMSLVVIGMQRGSVASIVMIGVVRSVGEAQSWTTTMTNQGSTVQHGQTVQGEDFSYYFLMQNYSAMTMFGVTAGTVFGNAMGVPPSLGFPASVSKGTVGGTQDSPANPALVAQEWYKLMVGDDGMMSKSYVPYAPPGTQLKIYDIIKQIWEDYDAAIPLFASFLGTEGSWMAKFQDILTWPWYEFFITTAPVNAYETTLQKDKTKPQGKVVPGREFTMSSMPLAPKACPVIVGRVNPIPILNGDATVVGGDIKMTTINVDRWSKLPIYDMTNAGFIMSRIGFATYDARNVYMINPTSLTPLFGNDGANTLPASFVFTKLADPASIHRYGYRPETKNTTWWFDKLGLFSQDPATETAQGMADCLLMLAGQYHPTPLMARSSLTIPLQPNVLPGCVFRYQPFKSPKPGNTTWDFYIDSVQHEFTFGRGSRTMLSMSRGLPSAIYSDPKKDGLLESIWKGNAQRVDGEYKVGLPKNSAAPLMAVEPTNKSVHDFLAQVGHSYVAPDQ